MPGPMSLLRYEPVASPHACTDILNVWRSQWCSIRLLQERLKDSPHISELETQLVSETGQDILTIPPGETEPALYRLS